MADLSAQGAGTEDRFGEAKQREEAKRIRAGFLKTKRTRHQQMQPKTVNTVKTVREKESQVFPWTRRTLI